MPSPPPDDALRLEGFEQPAETQENITDWCLEQFQAKYGPDIAKDDIWEYLYGVMHAPDWREKYREELQANLPRVPLVPVKDFETFRDAGGTLMDLHVNFNGCPEQPGIACEKLDKDGWRPATDAEVRDDFCIKDRMRWGKKTSLDPKTKLRGREAEDRSVILLNEGCRISDIPEEAHAYQVSGRSPLEWAVDSIRVKWQKNDAGERTRVMDDPNLAEQWVDDKRELVAHLRRLAYIGCETARIVDGLPKALEGDYFVFPAEDENEEAL